jgi:hypothetical protein
VFVLYVVLTVLQPLLLVLIGATKLSVAALPFELVLLVGLGYGRPLAWGVLIFIDTVALIALVVGMLSSGGHLEALNAVVALFTTAALEATLLSAPMRRHVQARGLALRRRASLPTKASG